MSSLSKIFRIGVADNEDFANVEDVTSLPNSGGRDLRVNLKLSQTITEAPKITLPFYFRRRDRLTLYNGYKISVIKYPL